jgi:hypothetical protein
VRKAASRRLGVCGLRSFRGCNFGLGVQKGRDGITPKRLEEVGVSKFRYGAYWVVGGRIAGQKKSKERGLRAGEGRESEEVERQGLRVQRRVRGVRRKVSATYVVETAPTARKPGREAAKSVSEPCGV